MKRITLPLAPDISASSRLWGMAGWLSLASGWWFLLALVLWACFIRPEPRSLALTAQFLMTSPALAAAGSALLLAGCGLLRHAGAGGRILAITCATACLWLSATALMAAL